MTFWLLSGSIDWHAPSAIFLLDQLEEVGAHFRSLHDPIDTSTPQGLFSLQREMSLSATISLAAPPPSSPPIRPFPIGSPSVSNRERSPVVEVEADVKAIF